MNKQKLITIGVSVAALIAIFSVLAGLWVEKVDPSTLPENTIAEPSTVEAKLVTLPEFRYFSGQVKPRQASSLSSRITARVAEVLVNAGDRVEQGDVLLRLESDDLSARVRQQQQALAAAQARVNEARTSYQRTEALVAQRLLPEAALDEAVANRDTAEAELNRVRETLSEAQTSEQFSVITAPYSGVISDRRVYTGDIATPGMQLLAMYAPQSQRFEADVSESLLEAVNLGDSIEIQLVTREAATLGIVTEIEPAADSASRSFTVKLELADTSGLYPGMYGQIKVQWQQTERLLVPSSHIHQVGQLDYVYVYRNQRREQRIVRLGEFHELQNERYVEVLSGVSPGERLLIP